MMDRSSPAREQPATEMHGRAEHEEHDDEQRMRLDGVERGRDPGQRVGEHVTHSRRASRRPEQVRQGAVLAAPRPPEVECGGQHDGCRGERHEAVADEPSLRASARTSPGAHAGVIGRLPVGIRAVRMDEACGPDGEYRPQGEHRKKDRARLGLHECGKLVEVETKDRDEIARNQQRRGHQRQEDEPVEEQVAANRCAQGPGIRGERADAGGEVVAKRAEVAHWRWFRRELLPLRAREFFLHRARARVVHPRRHPAACVAASGHGGEVIELAQ